MRVLKVPKNLISEYSPAAEAITRLPKAGRKNPRPFAQRQIGAHKKVQQSCRFTSSKFRDQQRWRQRLPSHWLPSKVRELDDLQAFYQDVAHEEAHATISQQIHGHEVLMISADFVAS